jgi:arginyl-tRNA--protein-N-Asp/Glu arginylyltransferase
MNTTPNILKSRKFWIAVVDAIASIVSMAITIYFKPDMAALMLGVLAAIQPVLYALINGIATEDAAFMQSEAIKQAKLFISK